MTDTAVQLPPVVTLDPLFDEARAAAMVDLCERYGRYRMYGEHEQLDTDLGRGLLQRHDSFRGANRKNVPQWLLVVMHHSGLFDVWRLPIATGIAWFHDCAGGELAYWPDGPGSEARVNSIRPNTAMVLDTDSIFHGVDRIAGVGAGAMPRIGPGASLEPSGAGTGVWSLRDADGLDLARYPWAELRFSVSWKAYCFADDRERAVWRDHSDDLTYDAVTARLIDDLRARGRIDSIAVEHTPELGLTLIDEFVHFPGDDGEDAS